MHNQRTRKSTPADNRTLMGRLRKCVLSVLVASLLISGIPLGLYFDQQPLRAAPNRQQDSAQVETFLVQFNANISEMERAQVLADMNAVLVEWLAPIHVAKVQIPHMIAANGAVFAAATNPAIHFVERDDAIVEGAYRVEGAYVPNDPDFGDVAKTYAHELIGLSSAWDITAGTAEVIIAVLDTGLSSSHAELSNRFVPGYDFINQDADPDDDHGHGTHVAGIIAAQMDNNLGTAGVCPNCRVMPLKVLDKQNLGSWSTIAEGIIYGVDHGARIINVSLGGSKPSPTVEEAIAYAASKDVLIVAAAGNSRSSEPFYPAAYDHVLAVSATDKQDALWPLSNLGSYIDVAAPGYMIYSTIPVDLSSQVGYGYMTGTSMAAPHVAGLAGLLFSQDKSRTAAVVEELITASADDLGDVGWDAVYGHGRINAYAALTYDGAGNDGAGNDGAGNDGTGNEQPQAPVPPSRLAVKTQIFVPVVRKN